VLLSTVAFSTCKQSPQLTNWRTRRRPTCVRSSRLIRRPGKRRRRIGIWHDLDDLHEPSFHSHTLMPPSSGHRRSVVNTKVSRWCSWRLGRHHRAPPSQVGSIEVDRDPHKFSLLLSFRCCADIVLRPSAPRASKLLDACGSLTRNAPALANLHHNAMGF